MLSWWLNFFSFFAQTEKAVELLGKFEAIAGSNLDINEKYMKVLMNYSRDLEGIRKLYQKTKQDPLIPRNLPPVAGKIAWARQLYRKIEGPMKAFKTKPEILKVTLSSWSVYLYFLNFFFFQSEIHIS